MAQNTDLESKRTNFKMVYLDENLKNELRNSHFTMGNSGPKFTTAFQTDFVNYENKNSINIKNDSSHKELNKISNYKMGNDKVEYNTESQLKYITPIGNVKNI